MLTLWGLSNKAQELAMGLLSHVPLPVFHMSVMLFEQKRETIVSSEQCNFWIWVLTHFQMSEFTSVCCSELLVSSNQVGASLVSVPEQYNSFVQILLCQTHLFIVLSNQQDNFPTGW